ncbi:uncharacterized protein N0V96_004509 [Colletotrichum fioriniae]|uniref:uncharacterized protein n=1 Tax=Colletotrichum fioriniae TaxID=710243 RepID=UPI0032DB9428|nr:hypothetical protein N0V96_004509 [Colletotrichum fioriniae]
MGKGSDFWHSTPLPQHNVPAIKCTDGPNGVRGSRFFNPVPALCIPCGSGLGATWNAALIEQAGQLLSKECDAKGAHVWLGPTVNIIRSPLNGRGFESFSEDPHLSGMLAAAIIRGVQSRGTLAALKHFVANDQETEKMSLDVRMSDRALREIYLLPFQIALRDSNPRVVMSSYNKIGGLHVSENPMILQDILRKEWGFDGLIMSDWYGTYSCEAALNAGVDIEMPGPSQHTGTYEFGLATYGIGDLFINDELVINNSTEQTPGGMFFGKGSAEKRATYDMTAGKRYHLRVEAGSAATSKVKGGSLLAIPGGACRLGGCRKINPEEGIQRAVELANRCKYTFVVAGLNADLEKEGKDRDTMNMPPQVNNLIAAVLEAQPNTIVITQAGNPISLPWRHSASTMLHSWYGGNEAGNAVADVIFGRINPSGKLPMTFPARLEDNPAYLGFGSDNGKIYYSEDIFVGYRWYEARKMEVAFPFGHGLSYTTFQISEMQVSSSRVYFSIENTGRMVGAEVARLYISYSTTSPKSRFSRGAILDGSFEIEKETFWNGL